MRCDQVAGRCTPHYLQCNVGVDLQQLCIFRTASGVTTAARWGTPLFWRHTLAWRVMRLLVTDEIFTADSGDVMLGVRQINECIKGLMQSWMKGTRKGMKERMVKCSWHAPGECKCVILWCVKMLQAVESVAFFVLSLSCRAFWLLCSTAVRPSRTSHAPSCLHGELLSINLHFYPFMSSPV